MKKISVADNILYPTTLAIAYLLRKLPITHALRLGRRIGSMIYFLYAKRRSIAYANLKAAFGQHTKPRQLRRITKKVFQNLAQTAVEVLRLPAVDKDYIDKYVELKGLEHIAHSKTAGYGTIILTAHFGNWELSSLAGALRGYPQDVFVRQQKHSKLNTLLNNYRRLGGRGVITKGLATKQLIKALKENKTVSILTDQDGGASGYLVNFFGRLTSTPGGAMSFALKLGSQVLPHFAIREKGPKHLAIIEPPIELFTQDNRRLNIQANLQQFTDILQEYITNYPTQWLWLHKRWKTSPTRRILILSDGKAGHLNQSLAVAKQIEKAVREKAQRDSRVALLKKAQERASSRSYSTGIKKDTLEELIYSQRIVNIRFKNRFFKFLLNIFSLFASPRCQGCMRCVRFCLTKDSYRKIIFNHADVIVSCGWSQAAVNRFLKVENNAKSVIIMKPALLSIKKFDLAIMPKHDRPRRGKNVLITEGAPNLVNQEHLSKSSQKLKLNLDEKLTIGLLIGGSNKQFQLSVKLAKGILDQIIQAAEQLDAQILVTTSRRTSKDVEKLFSQRLSGYKRCKLLILANRENPPDVIGAVLDLSQVLVVSGESISMVSEAASCGNKVVLVFKPKQKGNLLVKLLRLGRNKHNIFLKNLSFKNHIVLIKPKELTNKICSVWQRGNSTAKLSDNEAVLGAAKRLI